MPSALRPLALLLAIATSLPGCDTRVTSTGGRAHCDGVLDPREDSVDDFFDEDGDGFVDGTIPECQDNYAPEDLDCVDTNPDIHPDAVETQCNDLDDDCDETTLDAVDADDDGYDTCSGDCNDTNPDVAPGFAEIACDEIDNDCDLGTADSADIDEDGWTNCDDCVDTNESVNPGETEIECDGADNDCDPATIDGEDFDGDGSTDCFDCDDDDPDRFPGHPEVCEDGIDQNCDEVDAECDAPTWEDTWTTNAVVYTCGGGNVNVDFAAVAVQDETPAMTFVFIGSPHPGALEGTIDGSNAFTADETYAGACSKTFTLTGSFLSDTSFSANLVATFSGCAGCANQSWVVTGTR